MCMFAAPVRHVSNTKIALMPISGNRQLIVYCNTVMTSHPNKKNAMILPFPLSRKEGIMIPQLVDFQKYKGDFWDDCQSFFPSKPVRTFGSTWGGGFSASSSNVLPTQKVGGYTCSIANSLEDLERLNRNIFDISEDVKQTLCEHYLTRYAFVVAVFDSDVDGHPLGIISNRHRDGSMYIPTRHEHGGGDHTEIPIFFGTLDSSFHASSSSNEVQHKNIRCDICHSGITGSRHKCLSCPDFDMCSSCYNQKNTTIAAKHNITHVFADIQIPMEQSVSSSLSSIPMIPSTVFYPNPPPSLKSDPEFDHLIYIFNGVIASAETSTTTARITLSSPMFDMRSVLQQYAECLPKFTSVQRVVIKGKRENKDYKAFEIQ